MKHKVKKQRVKVEKATCGQSNQKRSNTYFVPYIVEESERGTNAREDLLGRKQAEDKLALDHVGSFSGRQ